MKKLILPVIFFFTLLVFLSGSPFIFDQVNAQTKSQTKGPLNCEEMKQVMDSPECPHWTIRELGMWCANSLEEILYVPADTEDGTEPIWRVSPPHYTLLSDDRSCLGMEDAKNVVDTPKTAQEESQKTVQIESSPFSFIEVPMIIDIDELPTFVGLIGFDTAIYTPNDNQFCKHFCKEILEKVLKRNPSITIEDEKKVLESGSGFKNQEQKELYKILVTDDSQFKIPLSNKWTTLEEGDFLPEGSEVNGSWLRLKLDIELTEKVSAVLSLNDFQAEINANSLGLKWGEVEFKSLGDIKIHPTFTVKTDNAQISTKDTHFWVSYDKDKKYTLVGVYDGQVEVKTKDGKTITISPDGDKPGVVMVAQKLSVTKLTIGGLVLAAIIFGVTLLLKRRATKFPVKKKGIK